MAKQLSLCGFQVPFLSFECGENRADWPVTVYIDRPNLNNSGCELIKGHIFWCPFDWLQCPSKKHCLVLAILVPVYTSVTFATAAVRSYISTVSRNSTAAAVFLRLHTLAVTFATAAVRRILIYRDRKTAAALRPLRWWRTVAVGRPCGSRFLWQILRHTQGARKGTVRSTAWLRRVKFLRRT